MVNQYPKLTGMITVLIFLSVFSVSSAVTLQIDGTGQLTGATGVVVGTDMFDVSFVEGSCITVYTGCNELADFTFQTPALIVAASQALLDQVFLDGTGGAFDSDSTLTRSCTSDFRCIVLTPYAPLPLSPLTGSIVGVWNRSASSGLPDGIFSTNTFAEASTTSQTDQVYAVWTPHLLPFANFSINKAQVMLGAEPNQDEFEVKGSFELNLVDGDGFDLSLDDVTIVLAGFSETVRGNFFFVDTNEFGVSEGFQYNAPDGGVIRVVLSNDGKFTVKAKGVDLSGIGFDSPVGFSLQIGNDIGTTDIQFDGRGEFKP